MSSALQAARLLLEQLDLALRQPELLVVPDARDAHATILHPGLDLGEASLELALLRGELSQLTVDLGDRRLVGLDGVGERRDTALSGLQRLGIFPQALIDPLQCSERFDLCAQVSPPLSDLRVASLCVSVARPAWWAQCDLNTRPAGYEPAALTV